MTFILRIFFSGLITFVPTQNGKELTVLLLNGAPEHRALLLARGGGCSGDCITRDPEAAEFLYSGIDSSSVASDSLSAAASGGSVWELSGFQVSFATPTDGVTLTQAPSARAKRVPDTPEERADFRWVPNLKDIWPAGGGLNPGVLAANPPAEVIASRLTLQSGRVSTYSVIEIRGQVLPVDFRPLAAPMRPPYQRAAANWVEAEVRVPGNEVEIVAQSFDGGARRSMKLTPQNGVVEVAVLNISKPLLGNDDTAGRPGLHFNHYWALVQNPPEPAKRPIPQTPQTPAVMRAWDPLHPADRSRASVLLDRLLFPGGRGPYDQYLCPMSQMSFP
jgi:hypothetical protein